MTLSMMQTKDNPTIDTFQDAETGKWVPWPEAYTIETASNSVFARERLPSEAEAGDCWRSAVRSTAVALTRGGFLREDMERAVVA